MYLFTLSQIGMSSSHITVITPNQHIANMVLFRSGLITCLLATTSSAFAFKPNAPAYTNQRNVATTSNQRVPVNLSMSGGASAVPDLKAPPAIYEGAVAAGAGM